MFDYRKYGHPRTEEERAVRHARFYPGQPLPPRGTGQTMGFGQNFFRVSRSKLGISLGNFSNLGPMFRNYQWPRR